MTQLVSNARLENLANSSLSVGTVVELCQSGEILIRSLAESNHTVLCDFLESADTPALLLEVGDRVLFLPCNSLLEKGCVLGRIGAYKKPDHDNVQITAGNSLELKCGTGSIRLRSDGKILTKGVDVVSMAQQTQRIKGGSVQIN